MIFKFNNKLCPESLWNKFQQRCKVSRYATRNCWNLEILRVSLDRTRRRFHYTGLNVWNNIPIEIRELPLINVGVIRVCGTAEFEENMSRNVEL